jgi:hypothetical protein
MANTVQELNSSESQWMKQMKLLEQISRRLLEQTYDDTYESTVSRARACLAEMSKLAKDFPGREPFGKGYADALSGLRACLSHLEGSLKLLAEAKKAAFVEGAKRGWESVLESSRR